MVLWAKAFAPVRKKGGGGGAQARAKKKMRTFKGIEDIAAAVVGMHAGGHVGHVGHVGHAPGNAVRDLGVGDEYYVPPATPAHATPAHAHAPLPLSARDGGAHGHDRFFGSAGSAGSIGSDATASKVLAQLEKLTEQITKLSGRMDAAEQRSERTVAEAAAAAAMPATPVLVTRLGATYAEQ